MDPEAPLPFELDGWVDLAPFERTLGMKIGSSGEGEAVLTMPFTVKLAQGKGLLHGGAITTLAEMDLAVTVVADELGGVNGAQSLVLRLDLDLLNPTGGGLLGGTGELFEDFVWSLLTCNEFQTNH